MNLLNMKIIKVNPLTLYFLLLFFLCGFIKIGLIIFFIVIFHELGHALILKLFKYKIIDITIYPFGGIIKADKDINTPTNKELLISSGGILAQIILFIIIYLIPLNILTKELLYKYNLSIMLFNILPIIPLDGSIIINSLLNKILPYKQSYYLYIIISIVFTIIYLFFNYWYSINNYLIVSLFIIKTYYAIKNYKYLKTRFLLERYLNKYEFKYLSTKTGNLDILKLDTYQYFKEQDHIISERTKLKEKFDKITYE